MSAEQQPAAPETGAAVDGSSLTPGVCPSMHNLHAEKQMMPSVCVAHARNQPLMATQLGMDADLSVPAPAQRGESPTLQTQSNGESLCIDPSQSSDEGPAAPVAQQETAAGHPWGEFASKAAASAQPAQRKQLSHAVKPFAITSKTLVPKAIQPRPASAAAHPQGMLQGTASRTGPQAAAGMKRKGLPALPKRGSGQMPLPALKRHHGGKASDSHLPTTLPASQVTSPIKQSRQNDTAWDCNSKPPQMAVFTDILIAAAQDDSAQFQSGSQCGAAQQGPDVSVPVMQTAVMASIEQQQPTQQPDAAQQTRGDCVSTQDHVVQMADAGASSAKHDSVHQHGRPEVAAKVHALQSAADKGRSSDAAAHQQQSTDTVLHGVQCHRSMAPAVVSRMEVLSTGMAEAQQQVSMFCPAPSLTCSDRKHLSKHSVAMERSCHGGIAVMDFVCLCMPCNIMLCAKTVLDSR